MEKPSNQRHEQGSIANRNHNAAAGRGATFGGKSFFPTSSPAPLCGIHKCIGSRMPKRIAKKIADLLRVQIASGEKDIKAPTCFVVKPTLAKVVVTDQGVSTSRLVPVALHRGCYVNTRHQADYIAPKKIRREVTGE